MSTTFLELDETKLAVELLSFFARYEKAVKAAEPLFELEGRKLEEICRVLPQHQAHYDKLCQEAKQLVKWLENYKAKIEGRLTRNYLNGQRAYGARETATLISGEREMIEINQLIIEASLHHQRLDSIVEAFKQMGWATQNIVKLRVAELHQVIL
jgi:hypothetical protein